ncbi:zinc-binding protein A33-like [Parambassis ranga]|uniref:Zinc-binding protein A33-like n=1 Tax=Parambassis ranga TaxID=210632 RepID=A0A6P7I977_9TELE|nr:zinc-binding protein A33-like [Parambassis ranga]
MSAMTDQALVSETSQASEAEGLAPPSLNSPEQCEEHEESLSMFCLDDLQPLCKQCAAVSHAEHRVYILTEAAIDCKAELRSSVNGLNEKMSHFEKVTQTCELASKYNQTEVKRTEQLIKREFEELHEFLQQEEAARLFALREEQEEKKRDADECTDRMNQVIKSLEDKIQLIEEELDSDGDGVQFLQRYEDTMSSLWLGHRKPKKMSRPLIDVAKHLGNLGYAVWEKMRNIAPYTPVMLDPRTAGQFLRVSPGLNSIQIPPAPSQRPEEDMGEDWPVPANPERFHPYSCILARDGFNTGIHCWDIEVGDANNWTLGVAAQSVSRKTEFEACPEAGIWCIRLRDGEYRALTTPAEILNNTQQLNRVHVRLDCDGGMLEFRNADTDTHIFTFQQCFTETVYPYFESISAGGGLALLPQRVTVSVGADYIPADDAFITTSTNSQRDTGCATEEKKSAVCSVKETTAKKEKTSKNKAAAKKQTSKIKFTARYHVSLNKARYNECQTQKQSQTDHVDDIPKVP